jgi:hypothetical protein
MKKTFDCVQMKREAQRRLRAEYEARREEFASYAEFIEATAEESPEVQAFRRRHGGYSASSRPNA